MKYRWIDAERPVRCCGKRSVRRGEVGTAVVLPLPGSVGNVLVNFSGELVVIPAGCLRNVS